MIGDGSTVNIFKDKWIGGLSLDQAPLEVNPTLSNLAKVKDLLLENHHWNVDLLGGFFGPALVKRILSLPRENFGNNDKLVWSSTEREVCSASSLYELSFSCLPKKLGWIWMMKAQPRIAIFIWRFASMAIPTQQWQHTHHLSNDPNCPWGCNTVESLDHAFISCKYSASCIQFFSQSIPDFSWSSTVSILDQLCFWTTVKRRQADAAAVSGLLYHIWRSRNCKVHGESFPSPQFVVNLALHYSKESYNGNWDPDCQSGNIQPLVSWLPPPHGWIKINFDGALFDNGTAGIGFICRDHLGIPISAASKLQVSSAIDMVELRACKLGLELNLDQISDVVGVIIEGDSLNAINMIKKHLEGELQCSSTAMISAMLSRFRNTLSHVLRSANMATNFVVHKCISAEFSCLRGMPLPEDIICVTQQDWDVF